MEEMSSRVLAHLRKTATNRPKSRKTLLSYVIAHLGNGTSHVEAERVIENLSQAGYLLTDARGAITYCLEEKQSP